MLVNPDISGQLPLHFLITDAFLPLLCIPTPLWLRRSDAFSFADTQIFVSPFFYYWWSSVLLGDENGPAPGAHGLCGLTFPVQDPASGREWREKAPAVCHGKTLAKKNKKQSKDGRWCEDVYRWWVFEACEP